MLIHKSRVKVPDIDLVRFAIPEEFRESYKVVVRNSGEFYSIQFRHTYVAVVKVLESGFLDIYFLDSPAANQFREIMQKIYSEVMPI